MTSADGSGRWAWFLPYALAALVIAAFSGSAFRIDDPLFLWTARRISSFPLDPFGFSVNWFGRDLWMHEVTQNPPLASYYLALVSKVFGTSERALHLSVIPPALICIFATGRLAAMFSDAPGNTVEDISTPLLVATSPVFMLCSMTVMADILLLCFWCLSCMFWVRGVRSGSHKDLAFGALFSALSALTKYFGLACPLLLAAYLLLKRRDNALRLLWLLIPLLIVALWGAYSAELYGRPHVLQSVMFSGGTSASQFERLPGRVFETLAFTGGCTVFTVLLFGRGRLQAAAIISMLVAFFVVGVSSRGLWMIDRRLFPTEALLFSALCTLGAYSLYGAAMLLFSRADRSAEGIMLALWIGGTAVFVCLLNWTISGRNILPMVPAFAIMAGRHLNKAPVRRHFFGLSLKAATVAALTLVLSLTLTWSDYRLANAARSAAHDIAYELKDTKGTWWFLGHWGFQYYFQPLGGVPVDYGVPRWQAGDVLVIAKMNTNVSYPDPNLSTEVKTFRYRTNPYVSTMNTEVGAGFYSTIWGPMPFGIGYVPTDDYGIYVENKAWRK